MKINVNLEFDSIDEMVATLGGNPTVVSNAPVMTPEPAPGASDGVDAMPSPVELAAEHGIDLADVTGTGKDGRITKKDVQGVIDAAKAPAAPPPETAPETGPETAPETGAVPEMNALRAAITRVQEAAGLPACQALIKKFGVARVGELPDDQRQAFLDACDAAVMAA